MATNDFSALDQPQDVFTFTVDRPQFQIIPVVSGDTTPTNMPTDPQPTDQPSDSLLDGFRFGS